MGSYKDKIASLGEPSFESIREIATSEISHLSREEKDVLHNNLKRGTLIINSHELLCSYLYSFGPMHQAKLLDSIENLPNELFQQPFEIIDWGCGQAIGSICVLDYILGTNLTENLRKITLIDPSEAALERGVIHIRAYNLVNDNLISINKVFEEIKPEEIASTGYPVLHIFSNILDVVPIDLRYLSRLVDSISVSDNYLMCLGPLNPTNKRIDAFLRYFDDNLISEIYRFQSRNFRPPKNWTYKSLIYFLSESQDGHLIPIEYYPPVQFLAAYELDIVREFRQQSGNKFPEYLSYFEVVAPYDLGASVYDDVHPILAVIHNIIVRGLPTKSSVFVEECFQKAFDRTVRKVQYGEFRYSAKNDFEPDNLFDEIEEIIDKEGTLPAQSVEDILLILSPVAIARFQKVLVEAMITGQLYLRKSRWKFLVHEEDVPFAAIAVQDFSQLFHSLSSLSKDYGNFQLPEIDLVIVGANEFIDSPLHLDTSVYIKLPAHLKNETFDLVVTQSMIKSIDSAIDSFSKYNAYNNCYFNIRNGKANRSVRTMYTSRLIHYRDIVSKSEQGTYTNVPETKELLTYFLQLLFRKEEFRPGQLPILDRALKNLPVIGLLPTGGGKSLTYQIAALLQPGVTIVIDPLKSLMKDQYEGLIKSGIDCCAFINSSLSADEVRIREEQLVSSQLLFVLISPERLSIARFREQLKNMHDYNVYFSYGVIDEVHCVSEWGHDFRFSYLHLGRNLYNYVKAKEGVISLVGLTATASFDVLADVERELSGNGAFDLDSDVTVRHPNTNRLELQYKIERVPVEFNEDQFYDPKGHLAHLPRALNITNHWPQFDSKNDFLVDYLPKIKKYFEELGSESNIQRILRAFAERQNKEDNTDIELEVELPENLNLYQEEYMQAGLIFCTHVGKTGISVRVNSERIESRGYPNIGSFTGADDDDVAMSNLEAFRDNKIALMVATKAFGMGIDKPNVRFTINMNYSSSLESFVQEAGRAGRDKKAAIAIILVSDYHLVKLDRNTQGPFPIGIIRNKWFHLPDLLRIISEYNLNIPKDKFLYATPDNDIVKLFCPIDNRMFGFGNCSPACSAFEGCSLRKVNPDTKGWKSERELVDEIKNQNLTISKKNFQYLNADYHSMMYFFNRAFKGDIIEKGYMNQLLNTLEVQLTRNDYSEVEIENGFLKRLFSCTVNEKLIVKIPYSDDNYTDLSKAIYRMCCIELIEDFTQDYFKGEFRVVTIRKEVGGYYRGLKNFLLRYYNEERADIELERVYRYPLKIDEPQELIGEIYRCLAYLTEFVYDKISEKRKRAIDDMRNFCIEGMDKEKNWLELNESLKDFVFFYFNSKYAKSDYIADNGEPFSLVEDTDKGKRSSGAVLMKYLRVIEEDVVGIGTPLDNVKHLYGAVRLISRSLTDSNPSLSLLEAFCIIYLGFKNNEKLTQQFQNSYIKGMTEMALRMEEQNDFWELFAGYNKILEPHMKRENILGLIDETMILIHAQILDEITTKYVI